MILDIIVYISRTVQIMRITFIGLFFLLFNCMVLAQINIVPQSGGLKEYTLQNAIPYDSLTNVEERSYASLPGQTLFMHGAKDDGRGYYEAFFTGNFLDGEKHPIYKGNGTSVTAANEVVGKYYDVIKVWTKNTSACCLLLREKESGDEVYYKPYAYPLCMTCVGFYDKLKRYIGQTFLSLAKKVETEEGEIITPAEGAEYRCVGIGLKMNSDGAFLIMEGVDGILVEAFPTGGNEVYEFVSKDRIAMLEKQYGNTFGKQIAFRKVDVGMTKGMVIAAWGEPYRKTEMKNEKHTHETWIYPDSRYIDILDGKVENVRIYK